MSAGAEKSCARGRRGVRCFVAFPGLWPGCEDSGNICVDWTRRLGAVANASPGPRANHRTRFCMSLRTASCSCGQLRIEVEGEPRGVGICHCLACQRRTGSVFAALAGFSGPYKVFGTATEYVRAGDQGASFTFRFCPVCGTTVFHTEDGYSETVSVAVGAFADPGFPAPRVSVYDCRRHPWVQLPPGTTTFAKDPV